LFLKITEQNHFDLLDLGLVNFLVIVPLALWFGNVLSAKQLFAMKEAAHV
jgi:hypothetical protein